MMIGTVLGGSKTYQVFRFPQKPLSAILIFSVTLLLAGTITYGIVIGVTNSWTMWSFLAIGFELIALSIMGFAVREKCKSLECDSDLPSRHSTDEGTYRGVPLTPDSGESTLEEPKSEREIEEKESINVFVSPYEENDVTTSAIPRELSVEIEIGNLPIGEAIPFQKPTDQSAISA
jgi:hypothetical protein